MTANPVVPKPPTGLKAAGRKLWSSVLGDFELDDHEVPLLLEACRTIDVLNALDALVGREGLMSETSQGPRVHPAVAEARAQRIALARLLAALRVPLGDQEGNAGSGRQQKRQGARGVYAIQGGRA
jgi:hypothetical protein